MSREKTTFLNSKRIGLLKRINKQHNYKKSLNKLRQGLYTHQSCIHTINIFEEIGLITTKTAGRERHAKLTEKGKEILKNLEICGCLENEK